MIVEEHEDYGKSVVTGRQTLLTNGVHVSTATVILGQISPQSLVHICTSQHQQKTIPAAKVSAGHVTQLIVCLLQDDTYTSAVKSAGVQWH